ncbi:class I SAM-dependent methyltransferase [Entomospira culicis]|uniref:Methyltransferase domain-containing protein n=1 Tax=Entomospira culicis TaxID=2719989 RepID=A0A968GFP9_9SPIO|nr:class I SAM-dependent methyltransferase [Entomospira culicis]NIZ18963.1 methyltransferase domain-containing protein [Entomospira culicis]NIZ69178.1 methyltransferase domain-containing protein [Entomospira culicis]WDI37765.1 class I SAM-dependent methyltransferase [Entomospira culicis]WDI39393.1 class I SAM-dependent methyltransferase [Entomospira culicis]
MDKQAPEMSQEEYYLKSFMRSLKKRLAHRREWAVAEETTGYRLFDRENNIPLTIDFYNDKYAVVVAYLEEDDAWVADAYLLVIQKALGISADRLFYKERRKGVRGGVAREVDQASVEIEMQEYGLFYQLNLSDHLDVGIFMDHRNLRGELMKYARGLRVLNLFSYTGSFGLSMAAGGASEVINVDLSARYLEIAKANFVRNGLLGDQFKFIKADIMQWLKDAVAQYANHFDVIICDPPAFSNSRAMAGTLNIQRDYLWLIEQSAKLLRAKSGVIYFSSPLQELQFQHRKLPNFKIKEITDFTLPYDFRKTKVHRCWQIRLYWQEKERAHGRPRKNFTPHRR